MDRWKCRARLSKPRSRSQNASSIIRGSSEPRRKRVSGCAAYTIKKATQKKLKVTNGYKKAVKASKFKKKAKSYTFKVSGVKDKAKVTYQRSSKKIVVKKGKITLAKGIKKGTYRVTVKVAATKNYKATTKTIKIKVK